MMRSPGFQGHVLFLPVMAVLAAAYIGKFWYLLLTNLNFPWALNSVSTLAALLILLLSLIGGGACALFAFAVWRASKIWFAVISVITLLVAWLLYPVACDSHESFVDQPNRKCSCSGAMLAYYPHGVMDGSEIEYCIGLEHEVS